ncbi:hypothetical protein LCGC14_2986360 [marine sediment metagenome]|uniref:Uncharacterized protein n=1 Tax=marine sediment metagenome TaxID=412755 RepID=A0A0F8ZCJ5_9ZZZZ
MSFGMSSMHMLAICSMSRQFSCFARGVIAPRRHDEHDEHSDNWVLSLESVISLFLPKSFYNNRLYMHRSILVIVYIVRFTGLIYPESHFFTVYPEICQCRRRDEKGGPKKNFIFLKKYT